MRKDFLPFARPSIGEDAIQDIAESIRSGWITTGPKTLAFEKEFARVVDAPYALAVNSATAGLHLALMALGIGQGDEVVTTPMTFAATVNTILFTGARPVLADIDRRTLNIRPEAIEAAITPHTKAIVPVHFAGRPCRMEEILEIARKHRLAVIEDAAHAMGASWSGGPVGRTPASERRICVFSFHPTKNITTGEGGMVCTGDEEAAEAVSVMRQHGMSKGAWNRYAATGTPHYDIVVPGLKYNMLDIQAAIGLSQLRELDRFNARRRDLVAAYRRAFDGLPGLILPPEPEAGTVHSWHIFTPLIDTGALTIDRDRFMALMREQNIGTALHYQAVHLYTYYRKTFGWKPGDFPEAEYVSERIVSLPLFPAMTDEDLADAADATKRVAAAHLVR